MKAMNKSLLACLISLCAAAAALAAPLSPVELVRMERAIDVRVESGQFMGAVLVARGGEPLLARAYGLSNVAAGVPDLLQTRFLLGPVTEQITAAALLILEEHGQLKLDDPITKYLREAPASWDGITFFQLLTHTSGIPDLPSSPASAGRHLTPVQLVNRLKELPLDFAPGTSWHPSRSDYLLLGYLIEKISGVSYGRFLHEHLFAPLQMASSGYDPSGKLAQLATGYTHTPDGPAIAGPVDMSVLYSADGVYSTAGDLLKWLQGLYGGKVLAPESLREMTTLCRSHCAFGVDIEADPDGQQRVSQGGAIEGYSTRVVYVPDDQLAVIVLANEGNSAADELARDLRAVAEGEQVTLVSDRTPVTLSPAALDRLTGHYWTPEGAVITVERKDDHLVAEGLGGVRELYPQSARELFAITEDVDVSFSDDPDGRIVSLIYRLEDRVVHATRIGEVEARELNEERSRKVQEQTATPGSDRALRDLVSEIESGNLDDSALGPGFADYVRRQLPRLQQMFDRLGAIRHTDFLGVALTGADDYLVTFQNGSMEIRIGLGPDGRIWSQEIRPWKSS